MKDIEVLRVGIWSIEGTQEIFYYKVKLINNSHFTMSNIEILLDSFPETLEISSHIKKIEELNPNSFKEIIFRFKAKSSRTGGDLIKILCSYTDHLGHSQSIQIEPWIVDYNAKSTTPGKILEVKESELEVEAKIKYRRSNQSIELKKNSLGNDIGEIDEFLIERRKDTSKESQISPVYFSVYTPTSISPGSKLILNVWAYLLEQKVNMNEIASMKGDYAEKAQQLVKNWKKPHEK